MKIVHCLWSFTVGGMETMLNDIMRLQLRDGHDVTLVLINHRFDKEFIKTIPSGVHVVYNGRPAGSRNPWYAAKYNMLIRRLRPDVLHLHRSDMPRLLVGRLKCPVVLTAHDVRQITTYYSKVDRVCAISRAVHDDLAPRTNKPVTTVINGIDTDAIARRPAGKPCGKPARIVDVARLDADKKGQDILIKAVAILKARGINVSVDFIGEGPSDEDLRRLTTEQGVTDRVTFLGLRERRYVYTHLRDYDLMVHPSRFEGFGLTVAEAMAAALPVVVADGDGPYEVIARGEYGRAFANGSAEDCADAIADVIAHYPEALAIAEKALGYVAEQYSVRRQTDQYEQIYRSLIDARSLL